MLECEVRDELLVYSTDGDRVVALNASARAVWHLCDGSSSVIQIADVLGQRYGGLPGTALLPDVCLAVTALRDAGLVDRDDSMPAAR